MRRSRTRSDAAVLLCVALALPLAGCHSARVARPLAASHAGDSADSRLEFWHQLSSLPVTSNDDAFHALLLYFDGRDDAPDFATRVARLKSRGMLPKSFNGFENDAVNRGDFAVALAKGIGIRGGLTMQLLGGTSPRYAVRALQYRGLYPESSPNQTFSGAELVGVIGRIEDFQRGNPAERPAAVLPGEAEEAEVAEVTNEVGTGPLFLAMQETAAPAPATTQPATPQNPADLKIVVTGVEGDVQVRARSGAKWEPAKVGMRLTGTAEFRTGARSAVRFQIPPDQTYTLDRLGSTKVARAVFDGKKVQTDVGLEKGRLRYDLVRGSAKDQVPPGEENADLAAQFEAAGVEYDSTIRSPNAALAVRGTLVSLYDQPPFAPEAVSLTGRAVFRNTRRQLVAFGGNAKAAVRGQQTSAAQQALDLATIDPNSPVAQNDFDTRQEALVLQRGGFARGDVLVGNSGISDSELTTSGLLGGVLDFVLRWDGGPERDLADLNLAVISPLSGGTSLDFVANPPFTVSLTPGDPEAEALRAQRYPRRSPSGGRIGRNHVGPEGLEIASWPEGYPAGTYGLVVFNLVDPPPDEPAPAPRGKPIGYRLDTFLRGQKFGQTSTGTLRTLEISERALVNVPATTPP